MKKIKFKGVIYQYEKEDQHLSILDFLLSKNVDVNYHCKDGFCGACRCKINSGNVKEKDSIAFKQNDEILICCSTPISDIEINPI